MSLFIRHPPERGTKRRKLKIKKKAEVKAKKKSGGVPVSYKDSIDDDISSDLGSTSDLEKNELEMSDDEETEQEKRLRIAKKYLEEIEKEEAAIAEEKDVDKDAVSSRLKRDMLQHAGKLRQKIADQYNVDNIEIMHILKGHHLSVISIAITSDEKHLFSGSKDCSLIKWNLETGKRMKVIPGGRKGTEETHIGHTGHILCLALTSDDKYLASGCQHKTIHIWDPVTMIHLHCFKGHKDAVSGLAFQRGTHQLFSASFDRSVKIWNLDEMAYVETLFGHQDKITGIDAWNQERALTSGGRDNTLRIWKVVEESQLVFQGSGTSIDNCCLINEQYFLSGSDNGSLAVWIAQKKKPLSVISNAHGINLNGEPNWITSITSLYNSDLIASGSQDGKLRLWKLEEKSLSPLFDIPVVGFVNGIKFTPSGNYLIAAVGQEHRFGRWWKLKCAKNVICVIKLKS